MASKLYFMKEICAEDALLQKKLNVVYQFVTAISEWVRIAITKPVLAGSSLSAVESQL